MSKLSAIRGISALTLLGVFSVAPPATAAPIPVNNFSFEAPAVGDGAYTSGTIEGWVSFGGTNRGVLNPNTLQLVAPTDGQQVGYIDPDGHGVALITQTLGATLTAGESYTLAADFVYRLNLTSTQPDFTLALLAGGTPVASFTGGPGSGFSNTAFKTATVAYTASALDPLLGAALGIRISTAGPFASQIVFDNVRVNPVPLPPAGVLLATGLAATVLRRVKRSVQGNGTSRLSRLSSMKGAG